MNLDSSKSDSEKALDLFMEAFIESLKEEMQNPLEPFDIYANRVKFQIYSDIERFKERFKNGYHVLMEELRKEKNKSNDPT